MTNQEKYEAYRRHPFISQSQLKGNKSSNSPSLQRGNVLDCLVTNPEEFDDIYLVDKVPTPAIKNIIDILYSRWDRIEPDLLKLKELVMKIVEETDYGKGAYNWDRIVKALEKGGIKYWNKLVETEKIIITKKEKEEGLRMSKIILEHNFTKEFFNTTDYKKEFQYEIYRENFNGLDVKGLVDLKLSDDITRTYIDIKSIFNIKYWTKNFFEYRYDIQLPFYADIDEDERIIDKLIYIFVDPIHSYPIVYEMEDFIINTGKYGQRKYIIGYVNDEITKPVYKRINNKGYLQLIEDYKIAQFLPQVQDVSPELLINRGRVKIAHDF